jgi:hypothetical protein
MAWKEGKVHEMAVSTALVEGHGGYELNVVS